MITYPFLLHYYKVPWPKCHAIIMSLEDFKDDLQSSTFPWIYPQIIVDVNICWHRQFKLVTVFMINNRNYASLYGSRGKSKQQQNNSRCWELWLEQYLPTFSLQSNLDYPIPQILWELMGNAGLVTRDWKR